MRANRYPGRCADCRSYVRAGAGSLSGRKGAWSVRCADCADGGGAGRCVVAYNSEGRAISWQNSRGRCEDAPCCGCCGWAAA